MTDAPDRTSSEGVPPRSSGATLASADIGRPMRVVSTRLDDDVAGWIAAVGLAPGEEVIVLRRAAFGGPLHVRTGSGGEFAVAREIAACLEVAEVKT